MKIKIDNESNTLYFRFDDSPIIESEEVQDGIIFDFGENNKIIGIEILNMSKIISSQSLKTLLFETV